MVLVCAGAAFSAHAEGGAIDEIFVTANRTARRLAEIPNSVETISGQVLELTPGESFIDLLKKTANVDVIQYPGGLAGIGIRGFRPNFEFTINPRSLVLVDGHASGSTNFATISPFNIDRVEILRGPASSLYGASASGGVVNILTRKSSGALRLYAEAGYGSYDLLTAEAALGGTLAGRTDFDLSGAYTRQGKDFELGSDARQPYSDYDRKAGRIRLGADLDDRIRVDASVDTIRNRANAPGAFSANGTSGTASLVQRTGGDVIGVAHLGTHEVRVTGYLAFEDQDFYDHPIGKPKTRNSRNEIETRGAILQDTWRVAAPFDVTVGYEYQAIDADRIGFNPDQSRKAPFSPNETRISNGLYAEAILRLFDDRIVLTGGARYDWIESETRATAFKTNFTPANAHFETFNPRGGVVVHLTPEIQLHASAGTAFAAPQGNEISGETVEQFGVQTRFTTGNPTLKPESNVTVDGGVRYLGTWFSGDVTYFASDTTDQIQSVIVSETTTVRRSSYVNATNANVRGLELQASADAGQALGWAPGRLTLSFSGTRLFYAQQNLGNGLTPVRNVARHRANVAATYDDGEWSARLAGRYNGVRFDTDNSVGRIYSGGKGGLYPYPRFFVADAFVRWRFLPQHAVSLEANNLTDRTYYEKGDYPLPGRNFIAKYRFTF
jgi:vitamin B12 transporter